MKERSPSYYAAFHCLAGACPHTCCAAGWEIPLDRETALRYESLPLRQLSGLRQMYLHTAADSAVSWKNQPTVFRSNRYLRGGSQNPV